MPAASKASSTSSRKSHKIPDKSADDAVKRSPASGAAALTGNPQDAGRKIPQRRRRPSEISDNGSVSSRESGGSHSSRSSRNSSEGSGSGKGSGEAKLLEPLSPGTAGGPRRRRSVCGAAASLDEPEAIIDVVKMSEEEIFLKVLDMLEQHDEFQAAASDASEYSDDDEVSVDLGSDGSDGDEDSDDDFREIDMDRPLVEWELEAAWLELQNRRLPNTDVCRRMLREVTNMHKAEKNVVHVPRPETGARLIIVGDLHGHFGDLMHILTQHGEPQLGPNGVKYIFNGDFVDRGAWGPEVLLAIYCLKLRCPQGVLLNRGNHEDQQQNLKPDNGFVHSHCTRAWGADAQRMYAFCRKSFKELPLVHVISKEIVVIHGGLPLDPLITIADINAIDRRRGVPVHSCSLLGYPRHQAVKAKRDLETDGGEKVMKGSLGKLVERVGKSQQAIVRFSGGGSHEEVVVKLAGAPELEEDVEIAYDSQKDRDRHRSNRLFVALLWSDPIAGKNAAPSKRGAGCYFDERITQEFLRVNKLSLMIRSHEKRQDGYSEEHRSAKHGLMSATVFSASNYPGGAGEPHGNQAAVIILKSPAEGRSLGSTMSGMTPWRKNYDEGGYDGFRMSEEMKAKFQKAEADRSRQVGPRARALAKLREMVYCARPKLLAFWQRLDTVGSGVLPISGWVSALRACVVPDDDFPWEWVCNYMLKDASTSNNRSSFNYASYLSSYENSLSRKLADQWHGGAVMSIADGVRSKQDAEDAWANIDRNGDGRLSYQELRPLLRTKTAADAQVEEDRVYSVLAKMDRDHTGFVDRDEFVQAVVRCLENRPLIATSGTSSFSTQTEFVRRPSKDRTSLHLYSRKAQLLQQELAKWEDADISYCWAATQGAIRALAATTGCASSVFEVLDGDGDGVIDRAEFQQGLLQLLRGSQLLRTFDNWEPLLWKLVDEDGSGFVSPAELNLAFSVRESLSI
eukprot:TRINITY_DN22512_c0_g1_i1.p1 TRINITY_DN22512_c0_g1~~TRINITY_DN22512_c0_g1_i1.p1  ORF type:complete len:991 (-),score=179.40 TRINITY_DN22512_c0_g1_i1:155-3049(-)